MSASNATRAFDPRTDLTVEETKVARKFVETEPVTNSNEPCVMPASLADEPLAEMVIAGCKKFRTLIPYVIELRERFSRQIRGNANIAGCKTWTEFCEKHLDRTTSAVQRAMAVHTKPEPSILPSQSPDAPQPVPAAKAATQPAKPHAEKRKNRNEPIDDFKEVRKVAIKMLNIGMREMKKTEANHSLLDSAKTWAQCKLADHSGSVA